MFKLYNGCPNAELQAHLDDCASANKFIRDNGYLITWFPVECRYYLCEQHTYKAKGGAFYTEKEAATWLNNNKEIV